MKILVFSDSHRFLSGMVQAIEEEKPDQVIHLGDLMGDAEELSWRFQTLPILSLIHISEPTRPY